MINVQPFHDKLDKLQEYIHTGIDGFGKMFVIDFKDIEWQPCTIDEIIDLFHKTGYMVVSANHPVMESTPRKLTFEEWLNKVAC